MSASQWDRDAQDYETQLQQPYITYYNEADGVAVGYLCADTKYIDMIWKANLDIPWWATGLIGAFQMIFKTLKFRLSFAMVASKAPTIAADALNRVTSYLNDNANGFKWEKYNYKKDFRKVAQGGSCVY